jgi:Trypsin
MRNRFLVLVVAAAVALPVLFASSAGAVTNGQYDGNNHPYVAYLDNGVFACSGTILSPTVIVTAAHCFSDSTSALGTNSITHAPIVRVSFDPNLINDNNTQRNWFYGSYYFDPGFTIGAGGGLPGFDTHDEAVVILTAAGCQVPANRPGSCGPVPASASLNQYGALPALNLVDTLAMNTPVDLVGFGVQNFVNGGGPCGGPCKKQPGDVFTRFFAPTTLVASNNSISDEFIKMHSNKGGTCFGDSGGPDLLGGTHTVLAVNSFVANAICSGNTYSYRIDTGTALTWIRSTVTTQGGSLPS